MIFIYIVFFCFVNVVVYLFFSVFFFNEIFYLFFVYSSVYLVEFFFVFCFLKMKI